jgi:hypothetical protein
MLTTQTCQTFADSEYGGMSTAALTLAREGTPAGAPRRAALQQRCGRG